jgi:hypothetical protein
MTNVTGVFAMEKNVLHVLVFEISPLQHIFQIRFREA